MTYSMMVDSHMHVNYKGFSLEDIISYLDKNRIDCCWLLSWEEISPGQWPYHHLSVDDIYDAYLKYPSRIVPMYAPDPHKENAAAQLEYWCRKGIRGCGEMKTTLQWDSIEVRRMLSTAAKLGIPLLFHMEESEQRVISSPSAVYNKIPSRVKQSTRGIYEIARRGLRLLTSAYPPLRHKLYHTHTFPGYCLDFASLEIALKDYHNINFIAHGPMFWKHISADAANHKESYPKGPITAEGIIWRLLRDYPNLYADISALSGFNAITRDSSNAKSFLSLFEDKILYGTDNEMQGRDFLDSLGLSPGTYKKIYGENAYRLVNK